MPRGVFLPQLKRLARDWFLGGMISAVVLATLFPDFGASGGTMRADRVADAGIFAVFLLHGVGISTSALRAGLAKWKVHVLVQAFTFGVFPLLGLALRAVAGDWLPPFLLLGFLYLCALPSTISSSVAMTSAARGNVPAAIFNATLSSLLGIVATPVLMSVLAGTGSQALPLADAMLNVATLLLLPFVVGQLLRPVAGAWFARHKRHTSTFDRLVILLLVYVSFCDSVRSGLWEDYGVETLATTFVLAALILALILTLTTRVALWIGLDKEDEITAVFCGSKKTLASGVPMAKLIFGAHPGLGVIVLPIMFYHQIQLFVCSLLAARYARRLEAPRAGARSG